MTDLRTATATTSPAAAATAAPVKRDPGTLLKKVASTRPALAGRGCTCGDTARDEVEKVAA